MREDVKKRNSMSRIYGDDGKWIRKTRLWSVWTNMKQRCYNEKKKEYKHYGGRGITVCDEWKNNIAAFYNWAIKNGYSDNLELDRIDNDRGYCPDNCRFVTRTEQVRNRRITKRVEYNGCVRTLTEWAEILGIHEQTLYERLFVNGWTIERAFETKTRKPEELEYKGETRPIHEWGKIYGKSTDVIKYRLKNGMSAEDALTKPLRPHKKKSA